MKTEIFHFSMLFLYAFLTASCWPASSETTGGPATLPRSTPTPVVEKIDDELQQELARLADEAKGKIGVAAVMLETGDAAYLDRSGRYPMQSVYKLPIAMAVLKLVDSGLLKLDQEIGITPDDFVRPGFHSPIRNTNPQGTRMRLDEVMRYSVSESDGTASDVLLDLAKGAQAVQSYLAGIGINDLIVADSEKSISKDWETQYRNWSTPEAAIDLLRALLTRTSGLSENSTELILRMMTESDTGRRRLRAGIPDDAKLAHKTGTGGTRSEIPKSETIASELNVSNRSAKSGPTSQVSNKRDEVTSATNDIGIITLANGRHILIAVYIKDSPADTFSREKVIADIARAVTEKWNKSDGDKSQKPEVDSAP